MELDSLNTQRGYNSLASVLIVTEFLVVFIPNEKSSTADPSLKRQLNSPLRERGSRILLNSFWQ